MVLLSICINRHIFRPSSVSCRRELKQRGKKCYAGKLKDSHLVKDFQLSLKNRLFNVLQQLNVNEEDINSTWEQIKLRIPS